MSVDVTPPEKPATKCSYRMVEKRVVFRVEPFVFIAAIFIRVYRSHLMNDLFVVFLFRFFWPTQKCLEKWRQLRISFLFLEFPINSLTSFCLHLLYILSQLTKLILLSLTLNAIILLLILLLLKARWYYYLASIVHAKYTFLMQLAG